MNTISKQDYIKALQKLEKSPNDRIGTLGKLGVVATGGAAGALGATTLASILGISTLAGSSTLASLAGGVFVVSNPAGWAFATAAAGAAAAYAISTFVSSGGVNDERKKESIEKIKEKINSYKDKAKHTKAIDEIGQIAGAYLTLVENDLISQEEVTSIIQGVEDGSISTELAFNMANSLLDEINAHTNNSTSLATDKMTVRSAFIILLKHMVSIDKRNEKVEMNSYRKIMKTEFKTSSKQANKLFQEAPKIDDLNKTLTEIKEIVPNDKVELLIESLKNIANSDSNYKSVEKEFLNVVQKHFST